MPGYKKAKKVTPKKRKKATTRKNTYKRGY